MPGVTLVNIGDPELEYAFYEAERRVQFRVCPVAAVIVRLPDCG